MAFTVIETQEQLDAIIGERVARAEHKAAQEAAKQYADYDELKKKLTDYETQIADYSKRYTALQEAQKSHADEVAALNARIKDYETSSVKLRIAHEKGLPYEFASRLTGETEEDIARDAEQMAKFVAKPVAPMRTTVTPVGDSTEQAYRQLARSIDEER